MHSIHRWAPGRKPGPLGEPRFPPAGPPPRAAISPSPGDSLLLFKQRERISSQSSWAFRLGTSSEQPYIKVGNLFFIDLERNVLDLPEIDMEAAVYVSSVLWVHFQGISLANVWLLREARGFEDDAFDKPGMLCCCGLGRRGEGSRFICPWERIMVSGPVNQLYRHMKRKLQVNSNRKIRTRPLGQEWRWLTTQPVSSSTHISMGDWSEWKLRVMISGAERDKSHSQAVLSNFLKQESNIFTYTIIMRNDKSTNSP